MPAHQAPLVIVDPMTVWKDMSIRAFGTKLAIAFREIFAHIIVGVGEIVTERA